MRIITFLLVIGAVLLPLGSCGAQEKEPSWNQAQREATALLMKPEANLAALVKQVSASPPTSGQQALFRLSVLTRAGLTKESVQTLQTLKRLSPDLKEGQISGIYYEACDHLRAWEVAQALLELFAENVSVVDMETRLLDHWTKVGWTVSQIDAWLAARPKGKGEVWVKERRRFNLKNGRGEALLRELEAHARANPQDMIGVQTYIGTLVEALYTGRYPTPDLAWMISSIKPTRATDAASLASACVALSNKKTALSFYRKAIATALTTQELQSLHTARQLALPEATDRALFGVELREQLAQCLLDIGQPSEAQKWMQEAVVLRREYHLERNTLLAGGTQGASGERVIERQLQADEKTSKDDPQYWMDRAAYYRGRKELAQEEAALKKGLELTHGRSAIVTYYVHFLSREHREPEAVNLLRKELAELPPLSGESERVANLLAFDFPQQLRADDTVLWTWLESRPEWQFTEERLLWQMLLRAEQGERDTYFTRAEKLALGAAPSRAATLGWIENRMGATGRSIALLEYALEKSQRQELRQRAALTLFESYLDLGDWTHAEKVFPEVAPRLASHELPEWYSRIAVAAAKAGAKAEAMRLWSRVANLDLTASRALSSRVSAGLRDELIAFYTALQQAMPTSEIPPRLLKTLQVPTESLGLEQIEATLAGCEDI